MQVERNGNQQQWNETQRCQQINTPAGDDDDIISNSGHLLDGEVHQTTKGHLKTKDKRHQIYSPFIKWNSAEHSNSHGNNQVR